MTLIAAKEPCGASGYTWETAGEEGAQEVDFRTAYDLLNFPGEVFFAVTKKGAPKETQESIDAKQKVFDDAEAENLQEHYDDAEEKAGVAVTRTPKVKATPKPKAVKTEGPNNA